MFNPEVDARLRVREAKVMVAQGELFRHIHSEVNGGMDRRYVDKRQFKNIV